MSKSHKPKSEQPAVPAVALVEADARAATPAAPPAAVEPNAAAPAAASAAPASEPAAAAATAAAQNVGARLAALARRLQDLAEKRLAGSRAERLLKRAQEAKAALPRRFEAELDGLLDRAGLVRKSRAQGAVGQEPAAKTA